MSILWNLRHDLENIEWTENNSPNEMNSYITHYIGILPIKNRENYYIDITHTDDGQIQSIEIYKVYIDNDNITMNKNFKIETDEIDDYDEAKDFIKNFISNL